MLRGEGTCRSLFIDTGDGSRLRCRRLSREGKAWARLARGARASIPPALLGNKLHRVEVELNPDLIVDLFQHLAEPALELTAVTGMHDELVVLDR